MTIEQQTPDTWIARIQTVDGTILIASEPLPDRESATLWLTAHRVEVEHTYHTQRLPPGLRATFERCAILLTTAAHPAHGQRLAHIRQWLATRTTHDAALAVEWQHQTAESPPLNSLDWQPLTATDWFVDTPHGRAIIQEQRPAKTLFTIASPITHRVWIAHPTGATYLWNEYPSDFMVADAWVQHTLRTLDDPRIAEVFLNNIVFTLAICRAVLVADSDRIHRMRIESITSLLEEALP